jgi:hypothetical protein
MPIEGDGDHTIEGVRKIRASNGRTRASLVADDIRAVDDSSSNSEDKLTPTSARADLSSLNPISRSTEDRAPYDAMERLDRYVVAVSKALICNPCPSGRTFDSAIVSFSAVKS